MTDNTAPSAQRSEPERKARSYFAGRSLAFLLNVALVALCLYLTWPLIASARAGAGNTIALAILLLSMLVFAGLTLFGGRRLNLVLLGIALGAFAAGELYFRMRDPAPSERWSRSLLGNGQRPYVMFTGAPGSTGTMPPEQGGTSRADNSYTLDGRGFRIERPLREHKPPGELRIFVVGGSSVFNGAPLAKSIPGEIEAELRRRGLAAATVYNFGIVAAVSGQELELIAQQLADYAPDIVISYGGAADMHTAYRYDPRPGFPRDFVKLQVGTQMLAVGVDLRTAVSSQAFRSRLLARIFMPPGGLAPPLPLDTLRQAVGYGTPEWETAVVAAYRDNLHRMCRLGRAFGFKFYAVLQPTIHQKAPLSEAEVKIAAADANRAAYLQRQVGRAADAFQQLQAADGVEAGCRFVDLSRTFANDSRPLFWDFMHVNNDGNATIAAAIAAEVTGSLQPR